MNNIVLEKVWTQNSPIVVDNLIGTTVTGESEAHTFRVRGVDAAQEPVAITGTITGKLLNANNDTVALTGSLSNGIASVTLTETCYAVPGRFIISIFATNADVTQCLYCGVGNVFRASSSSIAYPTDSLPDITSLMADLEEILDGWPADYTQIQTAVTTLQSDVSDLKSHVEDIEDDVYKTVTSKNLIDPDEVSVGRLESNGTINTGMTNYSTSDYIPLESGKTYIMARESLTSPGTAMITGYAGYGLYDTSKTWIANSRVWADYSDSSNPPTWVITPASNCYIRVCCNKGYYSTDTSGRIILQEGSALDGYEAYSDSQQVFDVVKNNRIVQSSGQNDDKIMSQKAVTDYVDDSIETAIPTKLDDIVDAFYTQIGKNKYNATACEPQNSYYYNTSTGVAESANNYAITGKIPVQQNKTYIFSAGGVKVKHVCYYSGDTGGTFIDYETLNDAAFTTPNNCTFIGINLFAASHTSEQYSAAIAAAQLELGAVATAYEPYTETIMLPNENVEDGGALTKVTDITSKQSQVNLYDKTLAVDDVYYSNQGVPTTGSTKYAISGKIPVQPNTQYCFSKDVDAPLEISTAVYEFGEDGSFIRTGSLGGYSYGYLISFATGANTYYVGFNLKKDDHTDQEFEDTIDTLMLCYGTMRPQTYAAYNAETVVLANKMNNAYFRQDSFAGKKWMAAGTSITWYDGKAYQAGVTEGEICRGYIGYVLHRKRLIIANEGINGSTLGNKDSDSLINRYTTLDWANTDIATLEYGVNDLGNDIAVGTSADAAGTTTFAACLKTVIEYALAQNPTICLVICTEPDVRGTNTNNNGNTLKDYTDVTLEIAAMYRLPVCDWYYHSGINALNKGDQTKTWMTIDGTHPSDIGHARMGAMLNQVFDSLIP